MKRSLDFLGKRTIEEGVRYLRGRPFLLDVYVPKYVCVTKPQIVSPDRVRAWEVNLWRHENELLEYGDLFVTLGFKGTGSYDQVVCVETWDGDERDGWSHAGYRLLLQSEIKKQMKEWKANPYNPPLPAFAADYNSKEYYDGRGS